MLELWRWMRCRRLASGKCCWNVVEDSSPCAETCCGWTVGTWSTCTYESGCTSDGIFGHEAYAFGLGNQTRSVDCTTPCECDERLKPKNAKTCHIDCEIDYTPGQGSKEDTSGPERNIINDVFALIAKTLGNVAGKSLLR